MEITQIENLKNKHRARRRLKSYTGHNSVKMQNIFKTEVTDHNIDKICMLILWLGLQGSTPACQIWTKKKKAKRELMD